MKLLENPSWFLYLRWAACCLVCGTLHAVPQSEKESERVESGLQALYDFSSSTGPLVRDRSGAGRPSDLSIAKASSVRRSEGFLEVRAKTLILSCKEASRLGESIRRSGAVSIEAWVR
ncbi:MAG: hypothetical protein MK554_13625, partial [Planctomycetes bacterium]|nr:hypothetical protein [Planctomycetota bacterium]